MKRQIFSILAIATSSFIFAQVGINNTAPQATMDISAKTATGNSVTTSEGLLVPRVDRARVNSMASPATSTIIYLSDISTGTTAGTANANLDAVGFYYYNGTAWVKMGAAGSAVTANNGLTQTAGNIQLGGALTQPTTISGITAANTLNISGGPLRLLNGGVSNATTGNEQLLLGFQNTQTYKHAIKTRHNDLGPRGNAFDFYTWKSGTDALTDIGSRLVMTLDGNGFVGIGNILPAATLDITATAPNGTSTGVDGILVPRVTRERARSMASVPVSTLVYINEVATGTQTGSTQFVDAVGFYYNDGTNWVKLGASTTTTPLNVTAELDANYTALATDDIILYNTTTDRVLTLPTSGIVVGKKYYVSNIGFNGVTFSPPPRNGSYGIIGAGTSATIIYIGSGRWDVFTGY
ncbi:hypothetical protein LUD75_19010 [Epilithonimonas sp. JDS]|uniref:hypothetical protein n=1 Tax=Epilithonimonas sp. JDS TaxID=2902797 RepID=UPI001E3F1293|nr:hypothetical protein [Epilithonimonas sp. JDS]MCD9856822.1 hypothetical protein [Epilithonimonas sp. JDS]